MRKNWLAAAWGRWFRAEPLVPDAAFQDASEPYPGHWRRFPEPWPAAPAASRGGWRRRRRGSARRSEAALAGLPGPWRRVVAARAAAGARRPAGGRGPRSHREAGARHPRPRPGRRAGPARPAADGRSAMSAAPDRRAAAARAAWPGGCGRCRSAPGCRASCCGCRSRSCSRPRSASTPPRSPSWRPPTPPSSRCSKCPSGILADRWSRTGILIISSVAAAASALLGGLSHNVATYIVAALILGVYFAMNSGTVDSVVYDTVIEETGSPTGTSAGSAGCGSSKAPRSRPARWSAAWSPSWTSPRLTYFLTVPFVLASIIAFSRFREPRLHRAAEPLALRRHVATTVHAMTRIPSVRRILLLAALTALLSQAVFEFGPLWLVALHAPAAAFGPYWALLVATLGAGGYLAARLQPRPSLHGPRGRRGRSPARRSCSSPATWCWSIVAAQTVLALTLAVTGIHAGRLLHDAVPSNIRAGVSSGRRHLLLDAVPAVLARLRRPGPHQRRVRGRVDLHRHVRRARRAPRPVHPRGPRHPKPRPALSPRRPSSDSLPAEPGPELSPPPGDLACQQVVRLVSDYLDGDLPPDWRDSIAGHLTACDGCTAYLEQIRQTVELLEQIDASQRRPAPAAPARQAGTCKGAHP